ncbi:MAG: AAA family ATPase [Bosea sp.]|uniref:AAA family ATPase n=1 Tax=Bosea sp. (in: a-proteobacteria) TaxID=1871050 RepID=UPI00238BC513|nr:AAA family ATPase [Bosea sp. (in: a-proteobacteria)]MCP4735696.1 AAA family ATPase [Bosea sp. (in: a-proteobacteria)]
MNTIPSYDTEAVATLRELDQQRLLDRLRNQRPDHGTPEAQDEPTRDEPGPTGPASGPSVAIFDKAALLKQVMLSSGDAFGEDGPPVAAASSDEQTRLEHLRRLADDEPLRRLVVADVGMRERLARLREECPGFVDVIALVERAAALSAIAGTGIAFPPLLLVGPPGLGKTHFSRRLAAALGVEQHAFSCATNSDAQALLIGHPPTWRGARMGVLTEAVLGGETGNPLLVLDEIDKFVTHSTEKPYNALLALLELENACALVDEYLRVPFDLSRCLILATANDLDALPAFIQDRFLIVTAAPPDGAMLQAIAGRIAADIIGTLSDAFALPDEDVVLRLATTHPRGIRRLVALALGFAAEAGRRQLVVADVDAAEAILVAGSESARRPIGFIAPIAKGGRGRE